MRRKRWAIYLWPGLPQLWLRGSWSALGVAVALAALLNLALLSSFGWSELIAPDLRRALWVGLGVAWVASGALSLLWNCRQGSPKQTDPAGDAFAEALEQYLKGNWFEAERVLRGMLRRNAHDPDVRLMLATLLRHTGRLDEAARQLDLLTRFEGAKKWELEMRRERELLVEAGTRTDAEAEETPSPGSTDPAAEITHAA